MPQSWPIAFAHKHIIGLRAFIGEDAIIALEEPNAQYRLVKKVRRMLFLATAS